MMRKIISLCVAVLLVWSLTPGESVTISGCTTLLELAGNVLTCATESATPTALPTATGTATATATRTNTPLPTATNTATATRTNTPAPAMRIAIIGDSTLDEYRANDNRGGAYASTTRNPVELLVTLRSVNAGAWGTRAEPRRSGYEYNWARSGDTSLQALNNQAPGVVAQLQAGQVTHVLIMIGLNDFAPWGLAPSPDIYSGALSGATLTSRLNTISDRISQTARTVNNAAPGRVLLVSVQDYLYLQVLPDYEMSIYSDPVKRQRIRDAIAYVNARIQAQAATDGIAYLDYNAGMVAELTARRSGSNDFTVGGQVIDANVRGDEPHHILLGDTYMHPGTAYNGLAANLFMAGLNSAFGAGLAPLTDSEILAAAGLN